MPGKENGLLFPFCDLGGSMRSFFEGAVGGKKKVSDNRWSSVNLLLVPVNRCLICEIHLFLKNVVENNVFVSRCPLFDGIKMETCFYRPFSGHPGCWCSVSVPRMFLNSILLHRAVGSFLLRDFCFVVGIYFLLFSLNMATYFAEISGSGSGGPQFSWTQEESVSAWNSEKHRRCTLDMGWYILRAKILSTFPFFKGLW